MKNLKELVKVTSLEVMELGLEREVFQSSINSGNSDDNDEHSIFEIEGIDNRLSEIEIELKKVVSAEVLFENDRRVDYLWGLYTDQDNNLIRIER